MAVTAADLQAVIPGLADDDATDLASAAASLAETYLRGGVCPESVQDHAILRVARFLRAVPGESGGILKLDGIERATSGVGDPLHKSGAGQLLARFRGVRVVTARADDGR